MGEPGPTAEVAMKALQLFRILPHILPLGASCCLFLMTARTRAQGDKSEKRNIDGTVGAVFFSDIHFEPFWDPEKARQLANTPVEKWQLILAAPDSPDRAAKFAAVQSACPTRGEDTTYALYDSALRTMRKEASGARFVTVSGDLIAHSFPCKFKAAFPNAAPGEFRAFAEKTVAFVVGSLRRALPGIPVYAALGNNDSDCGDYQLDANSEFLATIGKVMVADLPEGEQRRAERDFSTAGYFGVSLPVPIEHARLLVLDDVFMSRKYATCGGKSDQSPATAQMAWLEQQLKAARRSGEKIWVMAHIPPGVDPYSTASKGKDVCQGSKPIMFLSSEALPDTLARYGDVIRLAIFAHTHMDELRLLAPVSAKGDGVAVKLVPSISPFAGNNPSFTVARIDRRSATLRDYRVFVASNQTGVDTRWSEEYDFTRTYGKSDFTAASLKKLIGEFNRDPFAQTPASQNFIRNYTPGMSVLELKPFWPQYVCALNYDSADAFAACTCSPMK